LTKSESVFDYTTYPEYEEGKKEYQLSGNKKMSCPNSPYEGGEKTAWLVGWLDARTLDVLSKKDK